MSSNWNPEFTILINTFIKEQDKLFTNNLGSLLADKTKERFQIKKPSDFFFGRLMGLIVGFATAHFRAFHGRNISSQDVIYLEELALVKCQRIKKLMDDSEFQ